MNTLRRLLARFALVLALFALPAAHAVVPGDVDALDAAVVGTSVFASAVQPDGKTIIAGEFTSVLGQPRNNIARLNADGTLDAGFNPNANNIVRSVAVQADGRILIGGGFTSVGGTTRNNIARVDATGALDAGFNPNANNDVDSVAVQADGGILLGGGFTSVGGTTRNNIARVDATGALDAGFNPNANNIVYSVAVQTDGRILIGGGFTSVGGTARNRIARVDAAGALDAGFNPNPNFSALNRTVLSMAVQADGRILLGGDFTSVGGIARNRIARVNADGTLDAGFNPNAHGLVNSVAVQADGRILLGGSFDTVGGTARNCIARVDADGTPDAGFNPNANNGVYIGAVYGVALQADGRILLGGPFPSVGGLARTRFARLLNDPATQTLSAPDAAQVTWTRGGSAPEVSQVTFEQSTDGGATWSSLGSGTRLGTTANWQLTGLSLGTGQLRARGRTTTGYQNGGSGLVEAVAAYSFAPTVTASTTPLFTTATTLTISGTDFSTTPGENTVAFTPAGTGTVTAATASTLTVTSLSGLTVGALSAVVTTGGLSSGAAVQVATVVPPGPGDVDALDAAVVGTSVFATAVQPDGKTILAGDFTSVLGQPRNNMARLNADGTLDAGFNPDVTGTVYSVAVQADGRILLGGNFTAVGGTARNYLARVDAAGALDAGFDPNVSGVVVFTVAVQADGGILFGGFFAAVGGAARSCIARVNAAGVLDAGFNPDANSTVYSVAVQADGGILLGGNFTIVGGTGRNRIARVDAAGALDAGFNPNANNVVSSVVVQADGRILVGGFFATVGGTARRGIARLDAAGALDAGFNPDANNAVYSVAVQADGRILLGGFFSTVGGTARSWIARVDAAGALDLGFNPNADNGVFSVAVQADGRILLGGGFTTVGGTTRDLFARLLNDPATQTLSALDATHVNWTRGGSAPEVSQVTFEQSTDSGAVWTPLGPGTRIGTTPNWQLTGLSLPASGQLRARGRTTNGYQNGGSGLIEQVAIFPVTEITLTLVAPASGTTAGGASVTLTGTGFTGASAVTFGGAAATSFVVVNNNSITAITPAHAAGAVSVEVTVAGLSNAANTLYTYGTPPTVTLAAPTSGSTLGGTSVTLTGTDLTGTTAVSFGGTAAVTFSVIDATTLTATTPAHAPGVVDVVVTNPGGSGTGTGLFTYVTPPPTVTLSTARLLTTATTLTITGTGFSTTPGENTVAFTPAGTGTVTAATASTLTVTSLSGLTPGALSAVVTTGGLSSGAAVQVATVVVPGPGDVDALDAAVVGGFVVASAVQPDGKILLVGQFTSVLGQPRNNIARLNADGTLDAGFNPDANFGVFNVAVQADGRILIGGQFTTVGGITRNRVARVDAAGALDAGFDPDVNNTVFSMAVQADGGILLGGGFTTVGGTARNRIARVDAAGALDAGFDPNADDLVSSVAVQADGGILLGGRFTTVGGTARNRIARVDAAGALDAGFNPGANNDVVSVAVQADGRILLGGFFTTVGGTARNYVARVDAAGTLDAGFNPNANNVVFSMGVQADGGIVLGGFFNFVGGTARNYVARVDAAGGLDASFNPNANNTVFSVAVQGDGRILLGGRFTSVGGTARNYIARLVNDPATQTLTAPDATQATWTRGGSSPEVSQVTFEQSTDSGATWTPLGSGTRLGTTADWQLTGLALGTTGQLRARGRTTCGYQNGSSGLVEATASYMLPDIALEAPAGTGLSDGASSAFGTVNLAVSSTAKTFTIKNTGAADLTGLVVSKDGTNPGDFTVSALGGTTVTPGNSTTFTVSFTPGAVGTRSAALHLANNVGGSKNPFDLSLTGTGNMLPTAPDGTATATTGDQKTITLPFPSPDADGDTVTLTSTTPGAHLTVDGMSGKDVTFTPAANYAGTATLGYAVSDGFGGTPSGTITVTITDNDAPTASVPAALHVAAGQTGTAPLGDLTANVTRSDAVGVAGIVQSPDASTVLPLGAHPVSFTVSDAAGNSTTVQTTVTVSFDRSSPTTVTAAASTGEPAPGAGIGGLPAGAVLSTFGPPAISDFRDLAARVVMLNGKKLLAGIYVEDGAGAASLAAFQGGVVPGIVTAGVTFKSFLDPVIAPGGAVAFAGTVQGVGVKTAADQGVWTDVFTGVLELALREGSEVPGIAGAKLKSVTSLSLRDGELLALLTLLPAKDLVTPANDTVLLRITGPATATVLLREGKALAGVAGSKIKTISVLSPALGSPGHGRWHADGAVVAKVVLFDGSTRVVGIAPDAAVTPLLSTADAATPVSPQARWKSFGLPAVGSAGEHFVVAATLKPLPGSVTAKNDAALLSKTGAAAWSLLAREGGAAPVIPAGPLYATFFDPVLNDSGEVAFLATLQGTGIKAGNKTGLFGGAPASLRLLARLGGKVPDETGTPTAAVWSKFISHALPSGPDAGVVFLAETSGGGTTVKNKLALWAVDSGGTLRRLLRTNDLLAAGTPAITKLKLLTAVPGAFGSTRSFNATGSIAVLATFADKTQALLRLDVP